MEKGDDRQQTMDDGPQMQTTGERRPMTDFRP